MSHTPGPWYLSIGETAVDGVAVGCSVHFGSYLKRAHLQSQEHLGSPEAMLADECIANAKIMAAAPDLLEALEVAQAIIGRDPEHAEAAKHISAAIAKARGQS